ncbi:MAG: glycosyltransferase [Nibricoccus sp.]
MIAQKSKHLAGRAGEIRRKRCAIRWRRCARRLIMPETNPAPTQVEHLVPPGQKLEPVELSIVVPALNEALTVGEFVEWCHEGLKRAGVRGQILIVDSSTDETPRLVLERGGEVLRVPKRGLGRAYIDAIPFIRGKWIVMGDADLTYDFRELAPFVDQFRKGAEYVMGSRFAGSIEVGAMPPLHQYFGTPLTTWILNLIYRSKYTDIHCGMRGLTREALAKIDLKSQSWEYASEMVLKAARLGLRIAEVPVKFYKDREGRLSHHRRAGWLSPWIAGWINLKVMLVYSPDSFLMRPGTILTFFGLILSLSVGINGPFQVGRIGISLHWLLFGVTCTTLGYSCLQIGIIARIMHGMRTGIATSVQHGLSYNRGMVTSGGLIVAGLLLLGKFVWYYFSERMQLAQVSHSAVLGLLLVILGFQTFAFTLLLEMAQRVARR